MKGAAIAAILCYIMAMGMALPSKVAVSEDFEAQTQWHLQAPSRGCVEVSYSAGGTTFRTYACDDANGACIYSPAVDTCPHTALFHKPSLERVVNIQSRDHLFRYYDQIGSACVLTLLPQCCSLAQEKASTSEDEDCFCITASNGEVICEPPNCDWYTKSQADDCKCVTLPTGEKLCDPIDCEGKSQAENCRCLTLPNGERICDPIDCEGSKQTQEIQGNRDIMKALLEFLTKKN